jgi:hypothetical protein
MFPLKTGGIEVILCVMELIFRVAGVHNNCAVFPNIMGGFAIIHSTVNINEDKPFSRFKKR